MSKPSQRRARQLIGLVDELEKSHRKLKTKIVVAFVAGALFGFTLWHFITVLTR